MYNTNPMYYATIRGILKGGVEGAEWIRMVMVKRRKSSHTQIMQQIM